MAMLDGELEVFSPKTGRKVFVGPYSDGKLEGEAVFFMEDTGVKVTIRPFKNGLAEGEFLSYAADGKTLLERSQYKAGYLNGVQEKFHPSTGKKISEEHYVRGDPQGESKRWDEAGNLTKHVRYGPGVELTNLLKAPPALDVDACADKWLAAHRKEVGPDAPVSAGQFGEWEGWCREGKQPS